MSTSTDQLRSQYSQSSSEKDDAENEFEDFKSTVISGLKRRRTDVEEEDEKATECPICLCPCTTNGAHRIVSIKCGHLLGESCLLQWFREKRSKVVSCPKCNDMVRRTDIRPLYTSHIIAQDTSLVEDLRRQMDNLKKENLELRKRAETAEMALLQSNRWLKKLSEEKSQLEQQLKTAGLEEKPTLSEPQVQNKQFKKAFTLTLPNKLKGRNIAINSRDEMLLLSAGNASQGHGLQRLSLQDFETSDYIKNHEQQIRDVKVSPYENSLALSTGFDKKLHLTCTKNKYVVQTYTLERAGWSCSFDSYNPNLLYCGLANNTICIYDIRNTKTRVQYLQAKDTRFSVHSLQIASVTLGEKNILYSTPVESCIWKLKDDEEPELRSLPTEGNGYKPYSLTYDEQSASLLISSRRQETSEHHASTKHSIYHLKDIDSGIPCWAFENPHSQVPLARTFLYQDDHDIVACFSDETNKLISLRTSNDTIQSLPVEDSILDIKVAKIGNTSYLAGLSESRFYLYQHK